MNPIRQLRESRQLSLRQLSKSSGVPKSVLHRLETNTVDIRISTLKKLAKAYELDIEELIAMIAPNQSDE